MFDDLGIIFRLIIGVLVIAGFWHALRPQYVFTLRIEQGSVRSVRGTVTRDFVRDVESICGAASIIRGKVHGLKQGRSIILKFSGLFPADCKQQLRNIWHVQGSLR